MSHHRSFALKLLAGCALLAALQAAQAMEGAWSADLSLGRARQADGADRASTGINLSWKPAGWWVAPEAGYETRLFPLLGSEDREVTLGVRAHAIAGSARVHAATGYAALSGEVDGATSRRDGWYARVGALWPVSGRGTWAGLEFKTVMATDFRAHGVRREAGSNRLGALVAWEF